MGTVTETNNENTPKVEDHSQRTTAMSVTCTTQSGGTQSATLIIGHPEHEHHPVYFQAKAMGDKGLMVPSKIMDSLQKIKVLAEENNVDFVELVEYAVKTNSGEEDIGN